MPHTLWQVANKMEKCSGLKEDFDNIDMMFMFELYWIGQEKCKQ